MNGFVTDGNNINCRECKYGDKCNVGRGHGYRVGSCIQFEVEKKQTNADKIRNMEDDELAIWLCENIKVCSECIAEGFCKPTGEQANGMLEWLKQEADT